ncbi:AraC family transcriptional regulator [Urechidicola vernalis]|uniref:AraC family transcriptional regulator n=1 Tax=Urechidicola vernalis TaxID=3075600 RepID=A0ABU2Y0Z7_9FLAO|nr:AraC family transcriptional regulator [Urechidicola sp. P050]MDT0551857.1 AraC family transcriptional regulator [Urechidicola sp. P050]
MELKYKPSEISENESFYVERKKIPYYGNNWHYHESHELMFSIRGEGVRIVGDNIDHFSGEELVLIGGGLPHLFKNEEKDVNSSADFIVLKFKDLLEESSIFALPELSEIKKLIDISKRGLVFSKSTIDKIRNPLMKLSESSGVNRIVNFINVLHTLSEEKEYQFLATEGFHLKNNSKGEDRIQNVINYISSNYVKDISLEDLAGVAFMTTNSFCRYFKSRTGKTAFQFIREYRVNKACQLLINGNKSIAEICYDTGFNSLSSFNRIFKNLKKISASEYKGKYMNLNA